MSVVAEAIIAVRWHSALAALSSAWTLPSSTSSRDGLELCSELMEWVEEHEGRASRELMRLARMLRRPEYYQELLGARRYEVALANYHWALYILLGKLSPTLYVLRKNAST